MDGLLDFFLFILEYLLLQHPEVTKKTALEVSIDIYIKPLIY